MPSPEKIILEEFPERVMFSFTSRCNLSCWHCIRSARPRKGYDAPKELIDYVNKQILPHSKYLRIGGNSVGEPLLSENFNYFFSTLKRDNLREVHLVTNLTLLGNEKAKLIAENVNNLEISIEGTGKDYSRIRNFRWEKILKNIELLEKYRRKNKPGRLKITLLICTMLSNLESLTDVFDLKRIGVDRAVFREFKPREKEKEIECLWQDPKKTFSYIKKFEEKSSKSGMPVNITFKDKYDLARQHNSNSNKALNLKKCLFPWSRISLYDLGNISCCCRKLGLARLKTYKEDLLDIWNSEGFTELRRTVNSRRPWAPCLKCDFRTNHLTMSEKDELIKKYSNA